MKNEINDLWNVKLKLLSVHVPNSRHKTQHWDTSSLPLTFQLDLPQQNIIRFDYTPTLISKTVFLTILLRQFQKTLRQTQQINKKYLKILNKTLSITWGCLFGGIPEKKHNKSISWRMKFMNYEISNSNYSLFMYPI